MAHAVLGREDVDAGMLQEAHRVVHEVLHGYQHVVALAQTGVRQAQATAWDSPSIQARSQSIVRGP